MYDSSMVDCCVDVDDDTPRMVPRTRVQSMGMMPVMYPRHRQHRQAIQVMYFHMFPKTFFIKVAAFPTPLPTVRPAVATPLPAVCPAVATPLPASLATLTMPLPTFLISKDSFILSLKEKFTRDPSNAWNVLPCQVSRDLLPQHVHLVQLLLALEQRKVLEILVFTQEFAHLVQDVRITQEILAFGINDFHPPIKRQLDFGKHGLEFGFQGCRQFGGRFAVECGTYRMGVFVPFIKLEFPEVVPDAVVRDVATLSRPGLFEFRADGIHDVWWDDGRFSGLQGIQPLTAHEKKLKGRESSEKCMVRTRAMAAAENAAENAAAENAAAENAAENALWWTGGVLDGDGCVGIYGGCLSVSICQSEKGVSLLSRMQDSYGGAVRAAGTPRKETHHQTWTWTLLGARARTFCELIAPYTRLKQPQFDLAMTIPVDRDPETKRLLGSMLRDLKHVPHPWIPETVPLAYVAGMIDTDGSMRVRPYIRVMVGQKYDAITRYLVDQFGGGVTIETRASGPFYRWQVYSASATAFLESIRPHIVAKADQCDIVLAYAHGTLDVATAHHALQKLQGNQGKTPAMIHAIHGHTSATTTRVDT